MEDVRIYTRSDTQYVDFLEHCLTTGATYHYSKCSNVFKTRFDMLLRLHLIDIVDDEIIFLHENIDLWKNVYKKSFNWYIYYQSDKVKDKYGRLGVYYGEI